MDNLNTIKLQGSTVYSSKRYHKNLLANGKALTQKANDKFLESDNFWDYERQVIKIKI